MYTNITWTLVLLSCSTLVVQSAPAVSSNKNSGVRNKISHKGSSAGKHTNMEEMANMFEGDIILSHDQEQQIMLASAARIDPSGIVGEKYRWEDRVVHYEISSDYSFDEKEIIEGAMEEIADKTCIRFEERDSEDDYVKIEDGNGCSSKVGKRGGEQTVTLSREGCLKHGVAIHELVHAIGFWHEQSRTDRDKYVDIIWKNIQPDKYNNFKKYLRAEIYDYQVPYDYNSVMHYRADAFKREDTEEDTIVPKDPNAEIGQREGLSVLDARKINLMYCPDLVVNGTTSTTTEESVSPGDGDNEGDDTAEEEDEDDDSEEAKARREAANLLVAKSNSVATTTWDSLGDEPATTFTPLGDEPTATLNPLADEPAATLTPLADEPAATSNPLADESAVTLTPLEDEPVTSQSSPVVVFIEENETEVPVLSTDPPKVLKTRKNDKVTILRGS